MPTQLEYLGDALADVGAIQPNQTPPGGVQQFALRKDTQMKQSWAQRRLRLFFVPEVTYALADDKGTYTIGSGATDFDTSTGVNTKPVFIQAAYLVLGAGTPRSLNICTRPQWNLVTGKNDKAADGPEDLFYDFNHPIATINVSRRPTGSPILHVSQWNPLKIFGVDELDLNVEDFYPPEYIKAMRLGLAIELAPSYRFPVSQDMKDLFISAINDLERMNNDKLSGAFGETRTLDGPNKGDGSPVAAGQVQQQGQ